MKAARKGNYTLQAGISAGDLDGIFDGFRTCGGGDGLFREVAGHGGVQTLGQSNVGFIGHDLMTGVAETVDLRLDGSHDARMARGPCSALRCTRRSRCNGFFWHPKARHSGRG